MTDVQSAIDFLLSRAMESREYPKKHLNEMGYLLPLSEVISVLEMLRDGKFEKWLETLKKDVDTSFLKPNGRLSNYLEMAKYL